MTCYQNKILNILLDKYESSPTYRGENKIEQHFFCKPTDVFRKYNDDKTSYKQIEEFHDEVEELVNSGHVEVEFKGSEITKILLVLSSLQAIYSLLGREPLDKKIRSYTELLSRYENESIMLKKICLEQLDRLKNYKLPDISNIEIVLKCISLIEHNNHEILEREFSIENFSNSKIFRENYRSTVCKLLLKYSEYAIDVIDKCPENEYNDEILSMYNIVQNPTYVYLKGKGRIEFSDGKVSETSCQYAIALSSDAVDRISSIHIDQDTVLTIENLTSFNRMKSDNKFMIYLAGYHNRIKTNFIRKIAEWNKIDKWLHFGDIDPDGFSILLNLKDKTKLPFESLYMGIDELEVYCKYGKSLDQHDIIKAKKMKEEGVYPIIMDYMISNNLKLEQEIISWKLESENSK